MNHSKIILVACISAFVAITTAVLGVAGTIIGSVLSSVLYNVLSEALEKPVNEAKFSANFEWDIAYIFPLVVILIIQLLLILALLSEMGLLPDIFLNIYLSIQGVASNNLYRILGFSLIVMSVYPFILNRDNVKQSDGLIILLIGIIFALRGFSDIFGSVSLMYERIFAFIDFPMALISFLLLIYVINNILSAARASKNPVKPVKYSISEKDLEDLQLKQVNVRKPKNNGAYSNHRNQNRRPSGNTRNHHNNPKINESSNGIHFESNDLLNDFKK